MSDRRRTPRFEIPNGAEGTLRLMQDVIVERIDTVSIRVLADWPPARNEDLLVELPREHGPRTIVPVRLESSVPVFAGGLKRFRALLRVERARTDAGTTDAETPDPSRSIPALGILVRRVPVRVRDVSTAGCLFESADLLPDGAVGLLDLAMHGTRQRETLRICRSTRSPGSLSYRSGATFLALHASSPASVRNLAARFEIVDELGGMPDTLGRMYRRLQPLPAHLEDPLSLPASARETQTSDLQG